MLNQLMFFSTSRTVLQLHTHSLYPKVDWAKVDAGKYAIVDPVEPTAILYVSEKEYLLQIRVHLSQDVPLIVLCRPGDKALDPKTGSPTTTSSDIPSSSKNTPPGSFYQGRKLYGIPELFPARTDYYAALRQGVKGDGSHKDKFLPKAPSTFEPFSKKRLVALRNELDRNPQHPWHRFLRWHYSQLSKWSVARDPHGAMVVSPSQDSVMSLIVGWGFDLNFRLGGPTEPPRSLRVSLNQLAQDLVRILKTRGRNALILKMKNTLFFLDKWVGGVMNTDPYALGEPVGLARSGLPRLIPLVIRRRIAAGDEIAIRLMATLLSSYKAFEGDHQQQDLQSVTGGLPHMDTQCLEDFRTFCKDVFWPKVVGQAARDSRCEHLLVPKLAITDGDSPYIPLRGGPNNRVGLLGAPLDSIAWGNAPVNWPLEWCKVVGDELTPPLFSLCSKHAQEFMLSREGYRAILSQRPDIEVSSLALLPEPAGKVRTIAIVDYWTQRLMKPVHDWMMSVLALLPGDATFAQEDSLESYVRYCQVEGINKHYSIDLKSATDLIPITLYEVLLEGIWGKEKTEIWISLLTDRWFRVPDDELVRSDLRGSVVRYGRGQPMGALSSWASMALVHHALELFSAQRAGLDPVTFQAYRILGDDNVTGNASVAVQYLQATRLLGVPTSPAKTLEGKLFTFASQKFCDGVNLSPLSLREELGVKTTHQRLELALRAVKRGWINDKPTIARFLRLLLRQTDYVRSLRDWSGGTLGNAAQAALISAFGSVGRTLSVLGLRGSGKVPFLLALQGRVEALAGDQGALDAKTTSWLEDIELYLSLIMTRRVVTILRQRVNALREASIRFSEWRAGMRDCGILPRSYRMRRTRYILNYPERGYPFKSCGYGGGTPPYSQGVLQHLDRATWPVLECSYAPLLGVSTSNTDASDYYTVIGDDYGEQGFMEGVVISPGGDYIYAGDKKVSVPRVELKAQAVLDHALFTLKTLQTAELGSLENSPIEMVDSLFLKLATLPRLPEFFTLDDLEPSKDPKDVDHLRAWVRSISDYHRVLRFLPIGMDFSVGATVAPPGDLDQNLEAILNTRREVRALGKRRLPLDGLPLTGKTKTLVMG